MCFFNSSKKIYDQYKVFSYENLNQKLSYIYMPTLENKENAPISNFSIDHGSVNDEKKSSATKEIKVIDTTKDPKRTKFIRAHNYIAQVEPDGEFICISSRNTNLIPEEKQNPVTKFLCENKFKVHVSLPEGKEEAQQKQRALGWNIIKTILIDNNVDSFKIAHQDIIMSLAEGQAGKIITIYCGGNPEKTLADWKTIFEKIEEELIIAFIQPGDNITGTLDKPEKPIKGSQGFLYYRYDEKKSWPIDDPCDSITLSISKPENDHTVNVPAAAIRL